MTDAEKAEKQAEAIKAKATEIKDRKAAEIKEGFLNPFGEKTSYEEFLKEVAKEKTTVAEYCKGHVEGEDLIWLEKEIVAYKKLIKKD